MNEGCIALLISFAVATVSPGGAKTLATASGMRYSVRRSVPDIPGIAGGVASMAIASTLDLVALLLGLPVLEPAGRAAGSAYLLYLAWKIATSGTPSRGTEASRQVSRSGAISLTWYNPKAWAATMGASSSFGHLITRAAGQAALMGVRFLVFASASGTLWYTTRHALGRLLRTERQWQALKVLCGFFWQPPSFPCGSNRPNL